MSASSVRTPRDLASIMGQAPIFHSLTDKQLKGLAKSTKVISYPANTHIVRMGEPGIAFYVILSGVAEVRQGARVLATLAPGQFFGEMTLLDEQPRSADVVTTSAAECAVLSRWEFWGFAKTEPEVLQGILQEMARRLRVANQSLSE